MAIKRFIDNEDAAVEFADAEEELKDPELEELGEDDETIKQQKKSEDGLDDLDLLEEESLEKEPEEL